MNSIDRLIDWCKARGFGIDYSGITGAVAINTGRHRKRYASASAALEWAESFAKQWGLPLP